MSHKQNILIIGGGGREHALAWKISQSPTLGTLYVAPGNVGTAAVATNVPIKVSDKDALIQFAKSHSVDLTVVGPDNVLANGMVDAFQAQGLRIFGPTQSAARIESSKAFSKDLMTKQHVPTAKYEVFADLAKAEHDLKSRKFPLVVKASGLALGKGVYICANLAEASKAVEEIMGEKIFGESGSQVVIEDFLTGQEVSIHAFCDGKTAALFPSSQDHKRIFDNDRGPNTGGMGTFAPVPWVTDELMKNTQSLVVDPILEGLADANASFTGILYPGLMVDHDDIHVLEYNARFGDPEVESYVRLLETDLVDILNACVDQKLSDVEIKWSNKTAITVVLASGGYPGKYEVGVPITGIQSAESEPDIVVFHAGTKQDGEQLLTAGGRVLCVTATGRDLADAQSKAYAAIKLIHFDDMQYRTDIGNKAL